MAFPVTTALACDRMKDSQHNSAPENLQKIVTIGLTWTKISKNCFHHFVEFIEMVAILSICTVFLRRNLANILYMQCNVTCTVCATHSIVFKDNLSCSRIHSHLLLPTQPNPQPLPPCHSPPPSTFSSPPLLPLSLSLAAMMS